MVDISEQELQRMNEALRKAVESEKRNQRFLASLGPAIVEILRPTLNQVQDSMVSIANAVRGIQVTAPDVKIPESKAPNVTVNPPDVRNIEKSAAAVTTAVANIEAALAELEIPAPIVKPEINVKAPNVVVKPPSMKMLTKQITELKKAFSKQKPADLVVDIPEYTKQKPMPTMLIDPLGKPWVPTTGGGGRSGGIFESKKRDLGRYAAVDIATTATEILPATATRLSVVLTHEDDDPIYVGYNSSVTTANGTPVVANQGLTFDNYTGGIHAIISTGASSSTISIRYLEV